MDDQWGRSEGGKKSSISNLKEIEMPPLSIDLAELCGIILGDGHFRILSEIKQEEKLQFNYNRSQNSRQTLFV